MKKITSWALGAMLLLGGGKAVAQGGFIHPGLMHSEQDFERIRRGLAENDPQVKAAYQVLRDCWVANKGVTDVWWITDWVKRGISGDENYMNCYRNAAKAYQCAVLWKITGDKQWADRALYVLNTYADVTVGLTGNTNQSLIPAFIGYQFANAAELMRDCEYWDPKDFEDFKQWMIDVWFVTAQDFLERRHDTVVREGNWYHYHSNWGVGNALFCVSLGVLCDLPDIYNYGMYWLKEGPGNESLFVGPEMCNDGWGLVPWCHKDERGPLGYLNQMQESGRDQGHAMASLGQVSYWMQTAYNQGDNTFCNLNDGMIAGAAEYVAMFNSLDNNVPAEAEEIATIPYRQNWWMGGLGWTGQGQHRPIWQLFINHYENRWGIPMRYCKRMKAKLGIESGGNNVYGVNSGGYDHTGYGDLLHYDTPVTPETTPTVLRPQITCAGIVRPYAEMREVKRGTEMELKALLPEGEENTGKWVWEDGFEGQSRTITADHSGLWRVSYTNSRGIRSTQMFCISVWGEGIRASFRPIIIYDNTTLNDTIVYAVSGKSVTLSQSYASWNYIDKVEWFNESGKLVAASNDYTFTQGTKDQRFRCVLTNQSGVELTLNYIVKNSVMTPTLKVDDVVQETTSVIIPAGSRVVMRGDVTSIRYRNGDFSWDSGETVDSLVFDDLQQSVSRTLTWQKTVGSTIFDAAFHFNVQVYNSNRVLADGYYHFIDKATGRYFNNVTLKFEDYNEEVDPAVYRWHLTWEDRVGRYKIMNADDTKFLDPNGTYNTPGYIYRNSTYTIWMLTGTDDCFIRNSDTKGGFYWTVNADQLVCNMQTEMPRDFLFQLRPADAANAITAPEAVSGDAINIERTADAITLSATVPGRAAVYTASGRLMQTMQLHEGTNTLSVAGLPRGIYLLRAMCGTQTRTLKFAK
ncbi:MAG: alginate lyase family protein [Clostridium sp.]|nr:alginate lyase family protein [Clostridium sp.]